MASNFRGETDGELNLTQEPKAAEPKNAEEEDGEGKNDEPSIADMKKVFDAIGKMEFSSQDESFMKDKIECDEHT